MIIGELRTRNYEWLTVTNTTEEALDNLKRSWEAHALDVPNPYTWEELLDSVTLTPILLGYTTSTCLGCENLNHGESGKKNESKSLA